jgi:hypothetical protein
MEAAPPPIIETLDRPRGGAASRRTLRRAAWLTLDLLAIAGFTAYAIQALT